MTKILQISLLLLFISSSFLLKAQPLQPKDTSLTVKQVDLFDIFHKILHKPKDRKVRTEDYEPGQTLISVVPAVGYTLQTGFAALLSGNIAFHTDANPSQKLSSLLTSLTYTQYKQFIVPFQANVWTKGNKYNFVGDWRYMHYPSITYGIGSNTLLRNGYDIDFHYLKLHQSIFKSIATNLYGGIGYYFDYLWNVKEYATGDSTDFDKYGFNNSELASGPVFRLLYDSRLNQINPSNGFYSNIAYRPNFTFLGSHSNWQSILLEFRKYIQLPTRSKSVLALWSYNWFTAGGKPPYLLLPSTGWDDAFNTGRGYIQGRFRGRDMIYLESEYRFNITHNGLFGAVVFANAQTFSGEKSFEFGKINPGFGGGLRIKLNKYSGANLCIDYGFGTQGSKGFFVNLNEVF